MPAGGGDLALGGDDGGEGIPGQLIDRPEGQELWSRSAGQAKSQGKWPQYRTPIAVSAQRSLCPAWAR